MLIFKAAGIKAKNGYTLCSLTHWHQYTHIITKYRIELPKVVLQWMHGPRVNQRGRVKTIGFVYYLRTKHCLV